MQKAVSDGCLFFTEGVYIAARWGDGEAGGSSIMRGVYKSPPTNDRIRTPTHDTPQPPP